MKKPVVTQVGTVLLLAGLLMALISNHYTTTVMGDAALGVAVLAPEKGSKEWNDLVDLREKSDRFFYLGILLTAAGTLLLGASSLQSHERDVLPAGKRGDSTPWWITITVIAGVTSIVLRYLFAKEAFLAGGQTVILGVTAIALFLYARDTRLMAAATARQVQISEEMNYKPLARFSVLQISMVLEELRCPMSIELLRHIPFVAKVDLRLEVNGQLVPTESPLYDGEKEWVVYAGFRHLPGDVSRAILNNLRECSIAIIAMRLFSSVRAGRGRPENV